MNDFPWLSALTLLPLLGGVLAAALPSRSGDLLPKQIALVTSVLTFAVAVAVGVQ